MIWSRENSQNCLQNTAKEWLAFSTLQSDVKSLTRCEAHNFFNPWSIYIPRLASIDEASFHLNCCPTYGWSKKGRRAVFFFRPGSEGKRYSLLLCIPPTSARILDCALQCQSGHLHTVSAHLAWRPRPCTWQCVHTSCDKVLGASGSPNRQLAVTKSIWFMQCHTALTSTP